MIEQNLPPLLMADGGRWWSLPHAAQLIVGISRQSQILAIITRTKGDSMPAFALSAMRHWKIIGLGLLILALAVQTTRLGHRTNQLEREKINNNELRAELKRISSRKNEQQVITVEKIKQVETIRREADKVAEKIEQAPLPGNCKTPDVIMGADI